MFAMRRSLNAWTEISSQMGPGRWRGGCFALIAVVAACWSCGASTVGAHSTRSISSVATGRLHLVRAEGATLFEDGPVSGALTGRASARLRIGARFTAAFTIRTGAGLIRGHGEAEPDGSPGRYESFRGMFVTVGGSGRYVRVAGRGGLYGVFDRRTDAVVIQTTGRLSY